ncbi:hypothetical protein EBH_0027990 [Eimeria brunetti]|uniref:SAG family member n=1 Tax=Eimeria brunetti TaxID=51314 RepID=U6LPF0_9EIME|nr:hypothetical protein EBH_0027990 [Eimeria brunetti]
MASLYKTAAAVCLLALCGLPSQAAQNKKCKFTVTEVNEGDYVYANLVRNGKLPIHISEVAMDKQLVASLRAEVETKEETAEQGACDALMEASNFKTMFHHSFEYKEGGSPDYRQLLQDALDAGLAVFK